MKIHQLFKTIEITAGITDKLNIMQQNLNETIKQIYNDTYDGDRKYGVHKFNINGFGEKTIDEDYDKFHRLLDELAERKITGNNAINAVSNIISDFVTEDQKILMSILNKKMTIGLSKTSFNKLINTKEVKKEFEVTLAHLLNNVKGVDPIDGTWFASRKIDGCRVVAKINKLNDSIDIEFISRRGKLFTTMGNLVMPLKKFAEPLADGIYYCDGEGSIIDENGNENFQAILKEIKRKDWTIENPCYQIFDLVTEDEFLGKSVSDNFSKRYEQMNKLCDQVNSKNIKILKQELLTCQADFDRWEKYVSDGSWEGFMLRKDEPFKTGRIKTLLKVKKFLDAEYVVEDIETAFMNTSEPGIGNVEFEGVKSLIIRHKNNKVYVGSGLTKEQRKRWLVKPDEIIGKTITVKYFEETLSQNGTYSLRFPTLKAVYDNGRNL